MDFIEYSNSWQTPGPALGIMLFALAVLAFVLSYRNMQKAGSLNAELDDAGSDPQNDPRLKRLTVKSFLQLLLGFVLFLASMVSIAIPSLVDTEERRAAVLDGIESTYGLELTGNELKELRYPPDRPKSDFVAFGSIEKLTDSSDGFLKEEIYLIWKSDEMRLAKSDDGEKFSELKGN